MLLLCNSHVAGFLHVFHRYTCRVEDEALRWTTRMWPAFSRCQSFGSTDQKAQVAVGHVTSEWQE